MKNIKNYCKSNTKSFSEDYSDLCVSYTDMLESFGFDILLQIDDDECQGDTRVLFKDKKNNIGYLLFGWGSCSGCDALQGCNSWEECIELQKELYNEIKWLSTKEMLKFMQTHDWEGDYTCHRSEQKEFVAKAIKILSK